MNDYHLMIIINNRESYNKTSRILDKFSSSFKFYTIGHGTATSELLTELGLGKTSKNVVLMLIEESAIDQCFFELEQHLKILKTGHGIAFTIPLSSISGKKALAYLVGKS